MSDCDIPMQTQITIIICVAVVALFFLGFMHDEKVKREKEITNRILGTNGVEFKRRE